jgi:hypothetical protein
LAFRLAKRHDDVVLPKRKPHENGVLTDSSWHYAATPSQARFLYVDLIELISARLADCPDLEVPIQLIQMGQVVDETTLGAK